MDNVHVQSKRLGYVQQYYSYTKAEFLDEIQTKVLRVFLLAIHSHLYSFALRFSFSSNSRNLLQFLQFSYCTL